MIISNKAASIKPYVAGEQPRDKKYIKLNTNENPYPPSKAVAAAIANIDVDDLRLYPDPNSVELKRAIAKAEGVDESNIFVGNGSDEVLSLAFLALFNPNAKPIHFADITYSFYSVYCNLYDINYQLLPLADDYSINLSDYTSLGENSGGIVIANPNAPTSLALPKNKIEEVLIANANLPIIIDEAYIDFAPNNYSTADLVAKHENLLCVKTFSKSYSLAGLRCGYAIANHQIIAALNSIKDSFNSYPIDRVCSAAAAASISDREYFNAKLAEVIKTRDNTISALKKLGYTVAASTANFLFVTVKSKNAQDVYLKLKDKGILVRYFNKPRLTDKLRVTIGTKEEMSQFLKVLPDCD